MAHVTEPHDRAGSPSDELITALAQHSALFRAFTDHTPVGVGFASADFELVYANARWRELAGFDGALPAAPEVLLALVDPGDRDRLIDTFVRSTEVVDELKVQVRVDAESPGDPARSLSVAVRSVRGVDDETLGFSIGLSDVTELAENLAELRRSEERFRTVTRVLPVGVFRANRRGELTWTNEAMRQIAVQVGVSAASSVFDWVHPDDRELVMQRTQEAQAKGVPFESTHRMVRADGSVRWVIARSTALLDEHGRVQEYLGTIEDITELHLRTEGLAHQAAHDLLTGLPNRARIETIITELCEHGTRHDDLGIVFIDLDGFKKVNDTYGHQAGDAALVEVGRRLASVLRSGDVVGRYGGDEFVVVCPQLSDERAIEALARRLDQAISGEPIVDGDRSYHLGASIGTAIGPHRGETPTGLVHRADEAMYAAKRASTD
jgi:diguanylate cyclase (GGDEF)-like protein/PAS domain S-box-containing protein